MKKMIPLFVILLSGACAHAQGTLQFAAHLTGTTDLVGDGSFSLTGNSLSYDVLIPAAFTYNTAEIHGPGDTRIDAPLLFGLQVRSCEPPLGTFKGGCLFQ